MFHAQSSIDKSGEKNTAIKRNKNENNARPTYSKSVTYETLNYATAEERSVGEQ
jgi:hypothetical protein